MEEKKLTDEEIVKALDFCYSSPCCGSGCPYFNKHGRNFCVEDKALYKDMKRIVQENAEQKTKIERLTEELDLANETIDRNNKRYERVSIERQKALDRVDYLEDALLDKIRRNEELITAIKQAEQQAIKDKAKEICLKIIKGQPQLIKEKWVEWFKEEYGVEAYKEEESGKSKEE